MSYCKQCSDVFRSRWLSVQNFGWNSPVFGEYRSYWLWPVNDLTGNAGYFLAIILSEFQISVKIWSNLKNLGRKPAYRSYRPPPVFFLNQASAWFNNSNDQRWMMLCCMMKWNRQSTRCFVKLISREPVTKRRRLSRQHQLDAAMPAISWTFENLCFFLKLRTLRIWSSLDLAVCIQVLWTCDWSSQDCFSCESPSRVLCGWLMPCLDFHRHTV